MTLPPSADTSDSLDDDSELHTHFCGCVVRARWRVQERRNGEHRTRALRGDSSMTLHRHEQNEFDLVGML